MGSTVIPAIGAVSLLTAVAFAHAIGPGLMLAVLTPFDAIPFKLFGTAGNLITYVPIIVFLLRVDRRRWGEVFLGSRIQQWAALFVLALLASHAMLIVDKGVDEIFEWLRKLTLLMLLGVFAWSMRDARYLGTLVKVLVVSMAVFVVLSALDFYLGVQLLPVKAGLMERAALDTHYENHLATAWRFTGPGYPVNRFSNYLLLPIFLSAGWAISAKGTSHRALAFACTAVLISGELLTVTRSGILGMAVGLVVLLVLGLRVRLSQIVALLVVGGGIGFVVFYILGVTSGDEVLAKRFDVAHLTRSTEGRLDRIVAALKIWAESPFLGVGWGAFRDHSWRYISAGGLGAHNGYTNVLAECGLLGFIPLMILTVAVVRRHLVSVAEISPQHEFWRIYFLCGLVAQFTTNVFNDYLWERYLWVGFAYVVVLERLSHAARASHSRERRSRARELSSRTAFALRERSPSRS